MISTVQSCPAGGCHASPRSAEQKSFWVPLDIHAGGTRGPCMLTATHSVSAASPTLRAAHAAYAAGDDHTAIRLCYAAATQFRRFGCEHAASVLHACPQAGALP